MGDEHHKFLQKCWLKSKKKLSQCLKYIINNVYGLIATQKVAEYVFPGKEAFIHHAVKRMLTCVFKVLFLFLTAVCQLNVINTGRC